MMKIKVGELGWYVWVLVVCVCVCVSVDVGKGDFVVRIVWMCLGWWEGGLLEVWFVVYFVVR